MNHNQFHEFGELEWGTADGKRIPIKDLALDHFVNILNWINVPFNNYPKSVISQFEEYARTMAVVKFAAKEPYAIELNGKWQVVDPTEGLRDANRPPQEYYDAVEAKWGTRNIAEIRDIVKQKEEEVTQ